MVFLVGAELIWLVLKSCTKERIYYSMLQFHKFLISLERLLPPLEKQLTHSTARDKPLPEEKNKELCSYSQQYKMN
jgi:hypothetical protein